jgi:D-alanine-D-alanine ligase
LGFPLVIKPNAAGSSFGVEIVESPADFPGAFAKVASHSQDVLLEMYVPGRELTVAILLGRRLPLVEIRPREGFYDYTNKYTPGASEYLVPAPVHSPLYEQISDDALRLFDLFECCGASRVDFRLDGDHFYCLEMNTIPGMTQTSLVPKAAAAVGIGFGALVEDLCRAARVRCRAADSAGT